MAGWEIAKLEYDQLSQIGALFQPSVQIYKKNGAQFDNYLQSKPFRFSCFALFQIVVSELNFQSPQLNSFGLTLAHLCLINNFLSPTQQFPAFTVGANVSEKHLNLIKEIFSLKQTE